MVHSPSLGGLVNQDGDLYFKQHTLAQPPVMGLLEESLGNMLSLCYAEVRLNYLNGPFWLFNLGTCIYRIFFPCSVYVHWVFVLYIEWSFTIQHPEVFSDPINLLCQI